MTELNCNEVLNQWGNFGDNNPIEYGTIFVKADIEQEGCFYVVEISSPWATGDNYYLSNGYVDLNDSWIDWKAIKEYAGFDNTCQDTDDGYKVSALVNYYGIHEFGGSPLSSDFPVCENGLRNVVENDADAIHILTEFGIPVEGSKEIITVTIIDCNESRVRCVKASDIDCICETVDGEGIIHLDDDTTIVVSESLDDLENLLSDMIDEFDISVIAYDEEEEEGDNE